MSCVLLVDDEIDILDLLSEELREAGFEVDTAPSVSLAMELLSKKKYDIIFSDHKMSGDSGFDLIEKVSSDLAYNPTIYICSGSLELTDSQIKSIGGAGLITKPFNIDDIVNIIKQHQ